MNSGRLEFSFPNCPADDPSGELTQRDMLDFIAGEASEESLTIIQNQFREESYAFQWFVDLMERFGKSNALDQARQLRLDWDQERK